MALAERDTRLSEVSLESLSDNTQGVDLTRYIDGRSVPTSQVGTDVQRVYTPSHTLSENAGAWSTSFVWKSFETQEWDSFCRLQRYKERTDSLIKHSPFPPSSFRAYLEHRLAFLEDGIEILKATIAAKEQSSSTFRVGFVKTLPAFGGRDLSQSTRLLGSAIPAITAHDILCSGELDKDADFLTNAEDLLGRDLLKEL